jgi:hypothetical protein
MAHDKQIVVEGAPNEGRVILWEKDPIHPDGEVFITEGQQVVVGVTPAVNALLKTGKLNEVKAEKKTRKGEEEGNQGQGTPPTPNKEKKPAGAAVTPPATAADATLKVPATDV